MKRKSKIWIILKPFTAIAYAVWFVLGVYEGWKVSKKDTHGIDLDDDPRNVGWFV